MPCVLLYRDLLKSVILSIRDLAPSPDSKGELGSMKVVEKRSIKEAE